MENSSNLIFLTGCVNPDGMIFTKLQNPEVRKKQYIEAIRFYLDHTSVPILFVENSGVDISGEFQNDLIAGRLEILTFNGNNFDKNLGKGYGEMLIIKHGMRHSKLFAKCESVIKITGRYKVLNINSYLKPGLGDSYISLDVIRTLSICESKFWTCKKEFLDLFLGGYEDRLNDSQGYYFEHALLYATFDAIKCGHSYTTLVESPRFSGVFGSDNVKFNDTYLYWLIREWKFKIKNRLLK